MSVINNVQEPEGEEEEAMMIEEDERDLALELKLEVEKRDDLRPLNDFMLAQHAMAAHGCKEAALSQMEGLQCFYEEYGIDACDIEQGVYAIQQYLELHPTSLLFLNYHPSGEEGESCTAAAWDLGKVFPEKIFRLDKEQQTDRHWKIHVRGWFYITHAAFPNLETIRNGNIVLVEGSSFGWDNFSTKCENRLQEELFLQYPCKTQKVMWYNTNVAINTLMGMVKRVLPDHIQESWEVGCTISEGSDTTLSDLFLQPSPEIAQANLLRDIQKLLQERVENEKSFQL